MPKNVAIADNSATKALRTAAPSFANRQTLTKLIQTYTSTTAAAFSGSVDEGQSSIELKSNERRQPCSHRPPVLCNPPTTYTLHRFYIILYHIMSYYVILYHITSYYIILYHILSYYIMLHHIMQLHLYNPSRRFHIATIIQYQSIHTHCNTLYMKRYIPRSKHLLIEQLHDREAISLSPSNHNQQLYAEECLHSIHTHITITTINNRLYKKDLTITHTYTHI